MNKFTDSFINLAEILICYPTLWVCAGGKSELPRSAFLRPSHIRPRIEPDSPTTDLFARPHYPPSQRYVGIYAHHPTKM